MAKGKNINICFKDGVFWKLVNVTDGHSDVYHHIFDEDNKLIHRIQIRTIKYISYV